MLHFTLSKLPQPLNLESLISQATTLLARYPPETLPFRAWRRISEYSVLKTTRDPTALADQTLRDGERLFAKQAAQMRRQQAIQAAMKEAKKRLFLYRRPIGFVGVAVAVGMLALLLGRSGRTDSGHSNTGAGMIGIGFKRLIGFLMGYR